MYLFIFFIFIFHIPFTFRVFFPGGLKNLPEIRERQSENVNYRRPPVLEELDLLPEEDDRLDEPDDLELEPLDLTDDPELLREGVE